MTERARQRDDNIDPSFTLLEATKALVNTINIDTANKKPEEIVEEMLSLIHGV